MKAVSGPGEDIMKKTMKKATKNGLKTAILSLAAVGCLAGGPACAQSKPWIWSWWPSHWKDLDFKYHLEDPKQTHDYRWKGGSWRPGHWAAQRAGGGEELIHGFYKARIVTGQYEDDGVPVLEVGPGFYHLGGEDKRRVARTVDDVYGITASAENGIYMLYDWYSGEPVGIYSRNGLQLQ